MSDPQKVKKVLLYDLQWMDHTFTSRSVTESLLSPERESGNLSAHDYDASVEFFSGFHRRYPIMGTLAGICLTPFLSKAKWSRGKQLALLFALGVTGHTAGKVKSVQSHYNYVRSLENPYGFQKAMKNVQTQVGMPKAGRRLTLQWPFEVSSDDVDPDERTITSNNLILDVDSRQTKVAPPATRTKWDEIRSANSGSVRNSTWDVIRQQHERMGTKAPPKTTEALWTDDPSDQPDRYATRTTYDKGDKYNNNS